jgi:uncharacterized membrane protein (DUF4010 family)
MYLRVVVLVWIFNRPLALTLAPSFVVLALAAILVGWFWHRQPDADGADAPQSAAPHNPLELRTAFFFAVVFLVVLVLTQLAVSHLGNRGVYSLAAIMGVTDVDPFIMGMTHAAALPGLEPTAAIRMAASGILIATASNNLVKGLYTYFFARGKVGRWGILSLGALAILGLAPLIWL